MKMYKLDGGMLFELNRLHGDLGNKAIINDKELIIDIYDKYIKMGCDYIFTFCSCVSILYLYGN